MDGWFFTYILRSKKDGKLYTGYTSDLPSRLQAHERGKVASTKHRRPLELVYYEACKSQDDALRREKYLKTHYGKMFLGKRLKSYLSHGSLNHSDFTGQVQNQNDLDD